MGTRSAFVRGETLKLYRDPEHTESSEWIAIKNKLTLAERNALYDALIRTGGITSATETTITAQYGHYLTALMETAITGWLLYDEDTDDAGARKLVPFSVALIATFDPEDTLVDKVLSEVAVRYPLAKTLGRTAS